MMDTIELDVVTLTHSVSQNNSYAVVLKERNGNRRIPIVIGGFEAQAIAIALEDMPTGRPLTHDLFKLTFEEMDIKLTSVTIDKILDGIFYSKLNCEHGRDIYQVDSRTSDAIALAVRFGCPIYTNEQVISEVGIIIEEEEHIEELEEDDLVELNSQSRKLDDLSIKKLKSLMKEMIDKENYEEAARIRDAIQRKKLN